MLILIVIGSLLAFIVAAYITQARAHRIAGALAGGIVVALLSVAWDFAAFQAGVWAFVLPSGERIPIGDPLLYVFVALVYGGVLELIGWRIVRAFGTRGLLALLVVMLVLGPLIDRLSNQVSHALVYAPGIGTWLVLSLYFGVILLVGMGVMRMVAGPADQDVLARSPAGAV